jgi:integrase
MSNTVAKDFVRGAPTARQDGDSLYAADGSRKYLNLAERRRALAAMSGLDPDEALFALTLAWTGARVSEVLALTPASFQVEAGIVAFTTLKRRRFAVREVPLPADLMQAIDQRFGLRAARQDPAASQLRLWSWHRTTAWRVIKDVMDRCGIVGRTACPRGLRHGFGVGTLQAGVPINLVQRWLGHSRLSTTAIYAAASGPEEREFADRFWRLE